jgi:integrase
MPWPDVPDFLVRLRALNSVSALALEWCILTAARTGEVIGALWPEIDRQARIWIVPATRMKGGREHRVPLTDRCMEILAEAEKLADDWIFPGQSGSRPLSGMALAECLKGITTDATVHGFRSSFRDWAGEATSFSEHLAEAALAHTVGTKTERAYRRGDALERRRELMAAWSAYCGVATGGNVIALNRIRS